MRFHCIVIISLTIQTIVKLILDKYVTLMHVLIIHYQSSLLLDLINNIPPKTSVDQQTYHVYYPLIL